VRTAHGTTVRPYLAERLTARDVALWGQGHDGEDRTWTERYLAGEAFRGPGRGRTDGRHHVEDEISRSRRPSSGCPAFGHAAYVDKFRRLAQGTIEADEQQRFLEPCRAAPGADPDESGNAPLHSDLETRAKGGLF